MRLSREQIEYVNKEKDTVTRIIDSKPMNGLIYYHCARTVLEILIKLHNIEVRNNNNKE